MNFSDVNDDVKGNEFNERGEAIAFTSAGSKVCASSKDEASEPLDVNDQADRPALHAVETHRSDGDPREAQCLNKASRGPRPIMANCHYISSRLDDANHVGTM